MKKTKLSLALISCLLSVGTLAGCDQIKSSSNGVLLSYTVGNDKYDITADGILGDYYNDSTKYQAIFDTIYSVIARNYFKEDRETVKYNNTPLTLGKPQMAKIERDAREKVSDDKDTAQTNADTNNTKYKKEFEAILESKGVESEEELLEKYIEELQEETFENNFYTYFVDEIKEGGSADVTYKDSENNPQKMWKGYFEQQVPYHVSHILVKVEDSAGTNFANGTISQANAEKLADVVDALGAPESTYNDSFETIAKFYSEDTGSGELYGDLGIMDYSTSFVDEFKLGVYAYENFYQGNTGDDSRAKNSEIEIASDTATLYNSAVKEAFNGEDIPTIDKSVFAELREAADVDKDLDDHDQVLEGSTLVLPRNIIYNKYLNRHSVAFITGGTALANDTKKTVGYYQYPADNKLNAVGPVLSAKVDGEWVPILCVRAGSDYQGIHFIVINRSAFELGGNETHPVKRSDYYTTYYPEQDLYPEIPEGRKTYVNFSSDLVNKTRERAESFVSTLKSFDSDKLKKYIFRKYMSLEQIKISDAKLEAALTKWIDSNLEKSEEDRDEAWAKKWNEYIDNLIRQNSERNKLVPEACRLAFLYGNRNADDDYIVNLPNYAAIKALLVEEGIAEPAATTAVKEWFKTKGGLCNDGKQHS